MKNSEKQNAKDFQSICYKKNFDDMIITLSKMPNTAFENELEYQLIKKNQSMDGFWVYQNREYVGIEISGNVKSNSAKFNLSQTNRRFRKRLQLAVKQKRISICPF